MHKKCCFYSRMILFHPHALRPFLFTTPNMMAPRMKRSRTAASAAAATPKLTLRGGEPHHSELASLWRDARFTDIVAHGHR